MNNNSYEYINHQKLSIDTLIMVNSCEKDISQTCILKNSNFYEKLLKDESIMIIEYFRGGEYVTYENNKLHLVGEERYDKLHKKTYDMINWSVENIIFNKLIKLDSNFLTYNRVGERTRKKICGLEKVEKLIYSKKNKDYDGTFGKHLNENDYKMWANTHRIPILIEVPKWINNDIFYYCGKAYSLSYRFAKYICSKDTEWIFNSHNIKNNQNICPFSLEDVMVGRMFENFKKVT